AGRRGRGRPSGERQVGIRQEGGGEPLACIPFRIRQEGSDDAQEDIRMSDPSSADRCRMPAPGQPDRRASATFQAIFRSTRAGTASHHGSIAGLGKTAPDAADALRGRG
ncbi:MAG: hypothetical protein ABWY78_20215, partial [Microvirga sp.]